MAEVVGLTDAKVRGLKAAAGNRTEISDAIVPGLRVRVGTSGTKTFIVRKRVGGRVKNLTLGRFHETRFTLADARKKARAILSDIEAGGDPTPKLKNENRGKATSGSVSALWQSYLKAEVAAKRSAREIERIFDRYILPELGDRLADTITRGDITRLVDQIAENGSPVMARAVRAQISAFYSWAMPRLDRLQSNPARYAGRPPAPKARERTLTDDELRALWKATDAEGFPWRAGIKLLILTGQRREEVFGADRAEFDLQERMWIIPATRAKNGVEHLVPLSSQAVAILETVPEIAGSAKLFPARGNNDNGASGFSKVTAKLRKAVEASLGEHINDWRLHDLRRTMATGMQRLGIKLQAVESVLNHVSGSRAGIVGVYQRHDYLEEKRHALEAWAAEVDRVVSGGPRGNVVEIKGAAHV